MKRTGLTVAALVLGVAGACAGAEEGLDEMLRRAARRKVNAWPRLLHVPLSLSS